MLGIVLTCTRTVHVCLKEEIECIIIELRFSDAKDCGYCTLG